MRPVVRYYPPPPGQVRWPHVSKWEWEHWQHWMMVGGFSAEEIAQYRTDRDAYGLAVKRHDGAVVWLYHPTPKQVEAHKHPALSLLYGGAVGGAKSHWLRWDFYKRCLIVPEYQALILRRTNPELERTHIRAARREVPGFGAELVGNEVRFENKALIEFGHLQDERAIAKYLSAEYDAVGADEGATFPSDFLLEVLSRARSTKEGVKGVARIPTNPGGAHTLWLVDRFIDKVVSVEDDPFYDPEDHGYIRSLLYDNPWLMDADGTFRTYEKRLGPISPERRKQLLEGDWSAITGQYFAEFSRHKHVADLVVPPGTQFERWIDWGYNAPGICHWVACLPDKRLYVRHEWKFTQTIAEEVARRIREQTDALSEELGYPIRVRKSVADPSMWNKTGAIGESIAETFAKRRVPLIPGDNDREIGWQRLRHWFADLPDGRPALIYHPSCLYAIRTIPSLVSDKHRPEDVDTEGEDHAADADRYGVMARPSPTRTPAPPAQRTNPLSGQALWDSILTPGRPVLGAESVHA